MSATVTYTRAHSVTYVTGNMLRSMLRIILLSGLLPGNYLGQWGPLSEAVATWLKDGHLTGMVLEVCDPVGNRFVRRFDIKVRYDENNRDGTFWIDVDQLERAVRNAGVAPERATYRIVLMTLPGRRYVHGWSLTTLRSTAGMVCQSLGISIGGNGIDASTDYWRPA